MGIMFYDGEAIEIEDRALAHLKVVITTKLRRGESFTVSWRHPDGDGEGRSTIWLHQAIPLRFVFDDPEPATLSRDWLESLSRSANASGITLVAEPVSGGSETGTIMLPEQGEPVPSLA